MALDAFLILLPGSSTLPGGSHLAGIPSPDPNEPNGIAVEISTFDFGVERPESIGSATGGAGAGKAHNVPFIVTKNVDTLSPSLLMLAGQGTYVARMELYLRASISGASSAPSAANPLYTFQDVVVTGIAWSGTAGDEAPTEHVTFQYRSLAETTASPPPATATPTSTATSTPTPSATSAPTSTPTQIPTSTPTPTPTSTSTATPTSTTTPTPPSTATATPTQTLTPTPTSTSTLTSTPTVTPTSTLTPTLTPTETFTPTLRMTPVSAAPIPFPQASIGGDVPIAGAIPLGGAIPLAGSLLYRRRHARSQQHKADEPVRQEQRGTPPDTEPEDTAEP